jgi:AcrR family transcriptional regulator
VSRTQEERTAETRARLLDATIACIVDFGYTQTTTRRVAELAGVSAGAQAHHFPRRVDLVAAAAEHLVERRIEIGRRRAQRLTGPPEERLPALLDLIWADFSSPTFAVVLKLWAAAADEPELYERLIAGERRLAREITELAAEALAEDAESKLLLIFSACRGLALTEQLEPRERRRRDQWPLLREELLSALTRTTPSPARPRPRAARSSSSRRRS